MSFVWPPLFNHFYVSHDSISKHWPTTKVVPIKQPQGFRTLLFNIKIIKTKTSFYPFLFDASLIHQARITLIPLNLLYFIKQITNYIC